MRVLDRVYHLPFEVWIRLPYWLQTRSTAAHWRYWTH